MTSDERQLEREVTARLSLLRGLPEVRPSEASIARLHAALRGAALGWHRRQRLRASGRRVFGVAAALLLLLGWQLGGRPEPTGRALAADGEILNDWVNAADASRRAVARLMEDERASVDDASRGGDGLDAEAELDELFRSFEDLHEIGA